MGLFGLFTRPSMEEGIEEFRKTSGAVLLDVRTREEYAQGHIPGSCHIPLDEIDRAPQKIPDRDTPLFVHCRSGARSGQAVSQLKQMGYRHVKNIGGMLNYHGKVER